MCLQTGKVSNHFSGLLCLRIYHVFLCDKNRLESNSILNISIRSFTQTYKDELTLMVGRNPSWIFGSANSFGIRVCALTLKDRFGVRGKIDSGHQHAFLYPNKVVSTIPHLINQMVPLSLQNGKRAACFSFA